MNEMVMKPNMEAFTVHTDCLFDPKQRKFINNASIVIDPATGLIAKVVYRDNATSVKIGERDIDLRGKCVLPGLVDAHTHLFLHGYRETPSMNQMRDESFVERVVRATNHCRTALLAGYTTYRDLGTESLGDADVHLRDTINRGIIPGPRVYCATECLASSGGYEIRHEAKSNGVEVPRISDPCDGPIGCRAGVRRRIAAGADIVKFYADYRKRSLRFPPSIWRGCPEIMFPPDNLGVLGQTNPNRLLFQQDEMDAIVAEAKVARAPVAAHAATAEGVTMAARAGVTTIEHGYEPFEGTPAIEAMRDNGVIYVPTIAIIELEAKAEYVLPQVKKVFDAGVKIAAGGDIGGVPHGQNIREVELLLEAGIPLEDVLVAATLHGWEACGGELCGRKFGWIAEGCAADLIALPTDVRDDLSALRKVEFVMKDGKVWKKDGNAIGMI